MKIAIKNRDITPNYPCYMAGYERKNKSIGVLDKIEMVTCVIEINKQHLIFTSLDTISIEEDFVHKISKILNEKYLLSSNMYNLFCIHTHSGPALFKLPTDDKAKELEYRNRVFDWILEDIAVCMEELKEVTCKMSSVQIEGLYGNRNLKEGTADKEVKILTFYEGHSKVAAIVNMACHPTILNGSNLLLSSDLLGEVRRQLSQKWQVPVLLANGACGDVSTRLYRIDQDTNIVELTASELVSQLSHLEEEECPLKEILVSSFEFTTTLDFLNDPWTNDQYQKLSKETNPYTQNLLHRLELKRKKGTITSHLPSHIYLVGKIILVTVPGELVSTIGLALKEKYADYHVIIVAYCNNYVSYLVDEANYGKYFESYVAICPKGTVERLIAGITEKIEELKKE